MKKLVLVRKVFGKREELIQWHDNWSRGFLRMDDFVVQNEQGNPFPLGDWDGEVEGGNFARVDSDQEGEVWVQWNAGIGELLEYFDNYGSILIEARVFLCD